MGSVFLVRHAHTDERLALKVLHSACLSDPTLVERFRREARAPAQIDSDHVVRVTDADVAADLGGAPFLVMEYLRGNDLDRELAARGVLRPVEVVLYLRQAARALDKAHALGIVHRDLKPENLFLTEREDGAPCVKVLDFGIAKITGGAAGALAGGSRTRTGAVFGTPLYMAPEQTKGDASKICPQTDMWALGIIAYKLLTGRDLWTGETITGLISQIAFEPMPVPSARGARLGPAFDAWFARCCARESAHRFRSAGDVVTDLAAALRVVEGPQLLIEVAELHRTAAALASNARIPAAAPSAPGPSGPGQYAAAPAQPFGGIRPPPPSAAGTVAATPGFVPLEPQDDMPTAARTKQRYGAAVGAAPRDAPSGTGTVAGGTPPVAMGPAAASPLASSASPLTRSSRDLPAAGRRFTPTAAALVATAIGIMVAGAGVLVLLRSKTTVDAAAPESSEAAAAPTSAPTPIVASAPTNAPSSAAPAASSEPSASPTGEPSAVLSADAKTPAKARSSASAQAKATGSEPATTPKKKPNDDTLLSGRK